MKRLTSKVPDKEKRTILSELRRELGFVIDPAERKAGEVIKTYPRQIFYGMVVIILISVVLRFTILSPQKSTVANKPVVAPAIENMKKNSIDELPSDPMVKLQKMIDLRTKVEELLRRGHLSRQDSLFIINAEETIKKIKDEKN